MKKVFPYILLILAVISVVSMPSCGKKEKNIYLGDEIETEMPSETPPEKTVTAKPKIVVPRSSAPGTSTPTSTEAPVPPADNTSEPETEVQAIPSSQAASENEPETSSENTSGITFNDDGSVTVSQEILARLAEEEKEIIDSLGLSDKQVEILTTGGDITLSVELQNKLLDYLDTLSLTEKLRLLGKLAELIEN